MNKIDWSQIFDAKSDAKTIKNVQTYPTEYENRLKQNRAKQQPCTSKRTKIGKKQQNIM